MPRAMKGYSTRSPCRATHPADEGDGGPNRQESKRGKRMQPEREVVSWQRLASRPDVLGCGSSLPGCRESERRGCVDNRRVETWSGAHSARNHAGRDPLYRLTVANSRGTRTELSVLLSSALSPGSVGALCCRSCGSSRRRQNSSPTMCAHPCMLWPVGARSSAISNIMAFKTKSFAVSLSPSCNKPGASPAIASFPCERAWY